MGRANKHKSTMIATIMGLTLGPLGTIYFGLKTLEGTMTLVIISVLVIDNLLRFSFPLWFCASMLIFFGWWNYTLSRVFNQRLEAGEDVSRTIPGINFASLRVVYIWVISILAGGYTGIEFFLNGSWKAALIAVLLGIPAIHLFYYTLSRSLLSFSSSITDRDRGLLSTLVPFALLLGESFLLFFIGNWIY